jgi:RNA polymerase sigma-32 factor
MHYLDTPDALNIYLREIQQFDPLTFEDEQELAYRWRNKNDERAAHKLMQSYLRLVVKVAIGFKGYGLPVSELIQEGNIGLMHAITRFEPQRGFRLSTYAMWWIRAQIQEYVLNNWSLVKIGTTSTQKKLFFNLKRLRNQLREISSNDLNMDAAEIIAKELNVKVKDVISMEQRISTGDQSLNAQVGGDDEAGSEWQDLLMDDGPNPEELAATKQQKMHRRKALAEAIDTLDDREKEIFTRRRLLEKAPTLEELSQQFGISRERVRQLEQRAFNKVQKRINAA